MKVLIILSALISFGQQRASQPVEFEKISDNLYQITGGSGSNVGAYIGNNRTLVIDSKMNEESVNQAISGITELTDKAISFSVREPTVDATPGIHEGLKIGEMEVIYYIPKYFDPNTAQYFFGIHGAGSWHRPGAMNRIHQFKNIADIENLVVIAPAFDCLLNWPIGEEGLDEVGIVKDTYLSDFINLVNKRNEHRTDLKLIETFEFFNKHLMKRKKFHLYGHSGGGQFVSRFIMFYPELLDKVGISSPGSFVFPRRDINYPYGLKLDSLER